MLQIFIIRQIWFAVILFMGTVFSSDDFFFFLTIACCQHKDKMGEKSESSFDFHREERNIYFRTNTKQRK